MHALGTKTLHTDRLILRRFTQDDATDMFHNWAGNEDNLTYLTWHHHESVADTQHTIKRWSATYADPFYFNWAITLGGTVIGNISVVRLDNAIDACDIGYVLSKRYWGHGYMTEALQSVITFLIQEVGVHRVGARHDAANPASGRVMQKAGMTYEGTLRQADRNNQGICDAVYYSILNSELTR